MRIPDPDPGAKKSKKKLKNIENILQDFYKLF